MVNEEIDHASELPSIECPLRKQGINLHDLKPFTEVQKYIEFLERKDRELWQKPDAVIKELALKGTEKIADVGAGSGYFTFRLSKELPKGKVYAIDIEPEMIRHIHHKTVLSKIKNIEETLLQILDVGIVDGTPLLDIRPYVPAFDIDKHLNCIIINLKIITEKRSQVGNGT